MTRRPLGSRQHHPSISITKGVMSGEPCVDGTRIPVASIVALSDKRALTNEDISRLYPDLSLEEIEWAFSFNETYTRRRKRRKPADQSGEDAS